MRYWTHYWTPGAVSGSASMGISLCDHTASNQFLDRGVAVGDAVFVITYADGDLRVLGRLIVERVVDYAAAQRLLPYEPWQAADHLISSAQNCTKLSFSTSIDPTNFQQIEFVRASGALTGIKNRRDGSVEPQSFRGVREITPGTARLFEQALASP